MKERTKPGERGRDSPCDGLYGEAPPARRPFSGLRYIAGVGKVGKSVIWVCKRVQKG